MEHGAYYFRSACKIPYCRGSPCENTSVVEGRHRGTVAHSCSGGGTRLLARSCVDQEAESGHAVGQTRRHEGHPSDSLLSEVAWFSESSSDFHESITNWGPSLQTRSLQGTFPMETTTRLIESCRTGSRNSRNRLWLLFLHSSLLNVECSLLTGHCVEAACFER